MPNRTAKDRKIKRRKLNERWKAEGRTAVQHKKWLKMLWIENNFYQIFLGWKKCRFSIF